MIETEHEFTELELQRCVDGELSRDECRDLLNRIDRSGMGWRELALLFVEDRLVGVGCREFLGSRDVRPGRPLEVQSRSRVKVYWPLVAASLLVGLLIPLGKLSWSGKGAGPLAANALQVGPPGRSSEAGTPPGAMQQVASPAGSTEVSSSVGSTAAPSLAATAGNELRTPSSPRPIMELNLVSNGGRDRVPIPVFSPEQAPQVLSAQETRLSDELQQWLQKQGLELERQKNLIIYPLEDGSHIVIPAEAVRVRNALQ